MKGFLSSVVRRNFAALMTLQIGNYIFPLLLVPYLVRVLGFEIFGTWMFALAFVTVARTCVAYGFDMTATRQVALNRERPDVLSELYQAVVVVRLVIWVACFAALLAMMFFVADLRRVSMLVSFAMLILIGEILFPIWLFQGAETMALITKVKLVTKAVNLLLVLLFVKGPEDVLLVPLFEATTSVAAGVIALLVAVRRFDLRWVPIHISRVSSEIREGAAVFLAQGSVHAYTTLNVIILGFLLGPVAVAQYSIAEKIYSALRGLVAPFVQAIFPSLTRMHDKSHTDLDEIYRRVIRMLLVIFGAVGVILFVASNQLIQLVAGSIDAEATSALRVFSIAFPFALGSFLGPMLVVRQRSAVLMRITIIGGIMGLIIAPPLSWFFDAPGAAAAFLFVQIFNTTKLLNANRST